MHCKSLHSLPKFALKTQRIQVGNDLFVSVLFIIPVIVDIHRHRFAIYTLVSEINENVDLVLGIKNMFKLEGGINSWDCCFKFLNRSLPIFLKEHIMLKPKEQKLMKVKAPFIDEISGPAIIKILDESTCSTMDPMHSVNNVDEGMTHTKPLIPDVPFHPDPTYRPPPKPIRSNMPRSQGSSTNSENISSDINVDFEENSSFQEGVISEAYQRPDKSFFQEP